MAPKRKPLTDEQVRSIAAANGWQDEELVESLLDLAEHKKALGFPYYSQRGVKAQINKFKGHEDIFPAAVDDACMHGWKAAYCNPEKYEEKPVTPAGDTYTEQDLFGGILDDEAFVLAAHDERRTGEDDVC
jgi:hypothetical protein